MKKLTKILCLILSLSMLVSAFIIFPAQAAAETVLIEENFENMAVGSVPSGNNWSVSGTDASSYAKIAESDTFPNRAMKIVHKYTGMVPIVATQNFAASDSVNISFDFNYESISTENGKGGFIIAMFNADKSTRAHGLYIRKLDESVPDDSKAKVSYYDGSKYVDIANGTINKGEWYHLNIAVNVKSDGSYMDISVSRDGAVFASGSSLKCWRTAQISRLDFSNASNDKNDSYFLDNIVISAGDYMYADDFETDEFNFVPNPDNWVIANANGDSVDRSDIYIKVEKSPDMKKYGTLPSNKALYICHNDGSTGYTARYTFEGSSALSASFDFKYDGMDTRSGKTDQGVMVNFVSDDGKTRAIGLYIKSVTNGKDDEAQVLYYNGSSFPRLGTATLKKGEWYHFELDITVGSSNTSMNIVVTHNGETVISANNQTCSKVAPVARLDFSSPTYNSGQFSWIDNLMLRSGDKILVTEDYEDDTIDATPSTVQFLKGNPAVSTTNTATCYLKVMDCPIVTAESNKALNIVDASGAGPVRAAQSFSDTATMTVEFDYMLNTEQSFEGNGFIFFDGVLNTSNAKMILGIVPNKVDGVYDGTCTMQYFDHKGWKYIQTDKKDIKPYEWYHIKIELDESSQYAKVYLDGNLLCDTVLTNANIKTFDMFVMQTGSAGGKGENYLVDNLKITKPLVYEPFEDSFSGSLSKFYTVSDAEKVEIKNNNLVLEGGVTLDRTFGKTANGEFVVKFKTDNPEGLSIGLMSDKAKTMMLEADKDGKLYYHRKSALIPLNDRVLVKAGEWTEISIDLAPERNCNYATVRVNGENMGIMLYDIAFETVNILRIMVADGASLTVGKISSAVSQGIIKAPERVESDPIIYFPEVVEGTLLYLASDKSPASSTLPEASIDSIIIDTANSSVGFDFGSKQKVNAIRFFAANEEEFKINHSGFSVYYSDDNKAWTKINGYTYNHINDNGVWNGVFEFSGVEARYVKLNYTGTSSIPVTVNNIQENIRAERRIDRQWKLAGNYMTAIGDVDPTETSMTRVYEDGTFVLKAGDSIGINFGLNSPVEAVEIAANGISSLAKSDLEVYVSSDSWNYTPVENTVLSRDIRNGKDVIRLTFDSVECGYVKLRINNDVTLESLYNDFAVYSSVEADSYRKAGMWLGANRGGEGDYYTLPDGAMIMVYDAFPADGTDFSDIDVVGRLSLDGGVTWSEPWIMLDKPINATNIGLARFIWLEDGGLGMVYFVKTPGEIANLYIRRSYDYGRNWDDPILITGMYDWNYSVVSSGNYVLRLTSGRIVIAATVADYLNDVWGSPHQRAFVWYSDDDGYTWQRSDGVVTIPTCADEPAVAELPNGDLLMSIRTRQQAKIFQSISTDGGNTWSQPQAVPDLVTPSSTNVVVTIPSTGDTLLIWNNEYATDNGKRNPLTTAISSDNGLTFKNIKNVIEAGVSWPQMLFYGRRAFMQNSNGIKVCDVEELYYSTSGVKTVADLPKAKTPTASYTDGWLNSVSNTMCYSIDGGMTWKFCGGASVQIGDVTSLMVKDIGTHETAPSDIQTVK